MTVENENMVYGRHKESRMEFACTKMTVKNENKVFERHKRVEWSLDAQI